MIIFIDESGDPGFKTEEGSSSNLIIALVVFDSAVEALKTSEKIKEYRQKLKYSSSYEFKFNKTKKTVITGLLKYLSTCEFGIRAIIVNKKKLKLSKRIAREKIYNYLLVLLLERFLINEQRNEIRLDGITEREFKKAVTRYLRKNLKNKKIKFKMVNSKNDVLIQLADIAVGSIGRSYSNKKGDANTYKNIIKGKIVEEWVLKRSDLEPILK